MQNPLLLDKPDAKLLGLLIQPKPLLSLGGQIQRTKLNTDYLTHFGQTVQLKGRYDQMLQVKTAISPDPDQLSSQTLQEEQQKTWTFLQQLKLLNPNPTKQITY